MLLFRFLAWALSTWPVGEQVSPLVEEDSIVFLPYRYGAGHDGVGPFLEYDCSGWVLQVLRFLGITAPASTSAEWAAVCTLTEPPPGVWVGWREGHVGIGTGTGELVITSEAAGGDQQTGGLAPGRGVGFRRRPGGYFSRYWSIPIPNPGSLYWAWADAARGAAEAAASPGTSAGTAVGASLRPEGASLRGGSSLR